MTSPEHLRHVEANLLGNHARRNKIDGDPRQFGCVQFTLVGTNGRPIFNVVIQVHLDGPCGYVSSTFKFVTQLLLDNCAWIQF